MIIPEISTTTTILTPEQIELALKDISTLPVYSDTKLGAVKHGYKSGINNAPISQWLRNGYNLAISLPLSYLVCIDVDRHDKNGLIAYNELVTKFGEIDTYTELTPTNGGLHIFVRADGILDNVKNCDLAEGVEFKKNGYVVCAPSYFKGNQYKIINGVNADGSYKFAKLSHQWLDFINSKGKSYTYKQSVSTEKKHITFPQNTKLNYNKMLVSCRFLAYLKQHSEEIKEPVWYSGVNMLARNTTTDEFIHWLSQDYPKYTFEETQKKIEQSRKAGIYRGCNYIAQNHYELCKGCPKAEEIMRRNKDVR